MDSRQKKAILADTSADDVVRRMNYDFDRLRVSLGDRRAIVVRAKQLDRWVSNFIVANPLATVLHLGCGLDNRVGRVNPPSEIGWYEIDYPEVIDLRKRLYPEWDGCRTIASSVTEWGWMDKVTTGSPVLIVAEGLTMYLAQDDMKQLLDRVVSRFSSGEVVFDAISTRALRARKHYLRITGAKLRWGIDDPHEIEVWNPRLRLIEEIPLVGAPDIARLPWPSRIMCGWMNRLAFTRNLIRLFRYRF